MMVVSCKPMNCNDGKIKYSEVSLCDEDRQVLKEFIDEMESRYDQNGKMLTRELSGWNYHTDAQKGVFHEVRASFNYAVALLDYGDETYYGRAFNIIEKTITLQDQNPDSKSCGVWPYYEEEPLSTKKAPIDYNWADFNAVSLLDVWMGHYSKIPDNLKPKIKDALILAGKSIQKRNCRPGYTNIAIMGAYATYMISHLFDIPEMQEYVKRRFQKFYDYTIEKNGFSEYNSPAYSIVAIDELYRMKKHIIEPSMKDKIDHLYEIGWEVIARHFHKPSGQWAGPHSRSYRSLIGPSFYSILQRASNGEIDMGVGIEARRRDVKIKHSIPEQLMHYFLTPETPRLETNVFEKNEPQIIGTTFLSEKYTLSTANRSSMWNQRRPFIAYWGTQQNPKYLQVRFLHEFYDFSSATFYSSQKENKVLAGINIVTNGGDKHINIDRLRNGKFKAKDLRMRFEFGNVNDVDKLVIPSSDNAPVKFSLDGLEFNIQLYTAIFNEHPGYWEKGTDGKKSWIDYVIYSGDEIEINLFDIKKAAIGFTFSMGEEKVKVDKPVYSIKNGKLSTKWDNLLLEIPIEVHKLPNHL